MAAQPTFFNVIIRDPDDLQVVVDRVRLSQGLDSSAIVEEADLPPYAFQLTQPGLGFFEIEFAGHHTYRFDIEVVDSGQDFTVKFAPSLIDSPKMITLTKEISGDPSVGPGRNVAKVILGKPREFLIVAGLDYFTDHSGGMALEALATKRMHDIREANLIDDSTVITVFECKTGLRTRWVLGRGSEVKDRLAEKLWKSGWTRISTDGVKPTTFSRRRPEYPGVGVNGMPEIYRHIEDVGRLRPGTLEEFSVLSHSYIGGPLLYNTDQAAEFDARKNGARSEERDPKDRDGRFYKDFNDINMPNREQFKAAFHPDCLVKIWGCFATTDLMNMINTARLAPNDTVALRVAEKLLTDKLVPGRVFENNRPGVIQSIKEFIFKFNYMGTLAKVIDRPVFGGAPGMGALFKTGSPFGLNLFIAREDVNSPNGRIRGFKPQMDFLTQETGAVFQDDGYMRYDP